MTTPPSPIAPVISAITFDKALYAVGDTVTASVEYTRGKSYVQSSFSGTGKDARTNLFGNFTFTFEGQQYDAATVTIADSLKGKWTKISQTDAVAKFTSVATATATVVATAADATTKLSNTLSATFTVESTPPPPPPPPPAADPINARPNDGSGLWPDASNTGYQNYSGTASSTAIPCTHGYAGLYDYAAGMVGHGAGQAALFVTGGANAAFSKQHFRGAKIYLNNEGSPVNWTFDGCVFDGTVTTDNLVDDYTGGSTTYNYCTVKPDQYMTPPGNETLSKTSSQSGPGTPWSQAGGSQSINSGGQRTIMNNCDVWGGAAVCNTLGGTATAYTEYNDCYIHDLADADWSTVQGGYGNAFHQDGIGPDTGAQQSGKSSQYIEINHCTVASLGTSNGIAFQGTSQSPPPVTNVTITDCYLAGFGITVSLGAQTGWEADSNITFENNVLSAEIPYVYRALYGMGAWDPAKGMKWSGNRWQCFAGDPADTWSFATGPAPSPSPISTAWQGQYWWPTDNSPHATDYVFA